MNMPFAEIVTVFYPSTITYGSLFLCALIMQLVLAPCCHKYLPRLLYRMGIGLFLILCGSCSLTFLSLWLKYWYLFPYSLLAVPQLLHGCAYFLSFVTTIEFIVAQAPLRMQGLLIGFFTQLLVVLWYCQQHYHC